jgi:hypothetical protein
VKNRRQFLNDDVTHVQVTGVLIYEDLTQEVHTVTVVDAIGKILMTDDRKIYDELREKGVNAEDYQKLLFDPETQRT